jgi:hypothetical protein
MIRMGLKKQAYEVLKYLFEGLRPPAWNGWAEVVWREPRAPRFIGDLPHGWVGAEFIRSVRIMSAYEREGDQALVIGAGVLPEWVLSESGVSVRRLPTYHGTLNYSIRPRGDRELVVAMTGDIALPPGRIVLCSPLDQPLTGVTVNGRESRNFTEREAVIDRFPATVVLRYDDGARSRRPRRGRAREGAGPRSARSRSGSLASVHGHGGPGGDALSRRPDRHAPRGKPPPRPRSPSSALAAPLHEAPRAGDRPRPSHQRGKRVVELAGLEMSSRSESKSLGFHHARTNRVSGGEAGAKLCDALRLLTERPTRPALGHGCLARATAACNARTRSQSSPRLVFARRRTRAVLIEERCSFKPPGVRRRRLLFHLPSSGGGWSGWAPSATRRTRQRANRRTRGALPGRRSATAHR